MVFTIRIICDPPSRRWSGSRARICDMSQFQPDRSELSVNKAGPNVRLHHEQMDLTNPPKAEVTGSNPVGCAILISGLAASHSPVAT